MSLRKEKKKDSVLNTFRSYGEEEKKDCVLNVFRYVKKKPHDCALTILR